VTIAKAMGQRDECAAQRDECVAQRDEAVIEKMAIVDAFAQRDADKAGSNLMEKGESLEGESGAEGPTSGGGFVDKELKASGVGIS